VSAVLSQPGVVHRLRVPGTPVRPAAALDRIVSLYWTSLFLSGAGDLRSSIGDYGDHGLAVLAVRDSDGHRGHGLHDAGWDEGSNLDRLDPISRSMWRHCRGSRIRYRCRARGPAGRLASCDRRWQDALSAS